MNEKRTLELTIAAMLGLAGLLPGANAAAQSQPCQADSDCSDGMVCHTSTYVACSGGGGSCDSESGACPEPEPSVCEEISETSCTPRYNLPCSVDADCGGGFRCTEEIWVECEGYGGTGGSNTAGSDSTGGDDGASATNGAANSTTGGTTDSDGEPAPTDGGTSECTEVRSGTYYCQLLTVACEADADCPTGLTCQDNDVVCDYGDAQGGGSGEVNCAVPPGQPLHVCRPPYYSGGDNGGSSTGEGPGTADAGMGYEADAGVDTGSSNNGGGSTGSSGADSSNDGGGSESGGESEEPGHGHGHSKLARFLARLLAGSGGCSVSTAPDQQSGGNLSLLLGVGLALVVSRRRRP